MDHARGTRYAAVALTAFLLAVGPTSAEVKLRIYLQDGSLQSGTLVTETDKSFVVMTQAGRVEVPKSSIMFVNGKTLKQWQDRPDKLFQTEIIPSDIPNPAYVNDKSLPPPPPIPDLPKSVTPPPSRKPVPKATVVKAPAIVAPAPAEKKTEPPAAPAERKSAIAAAPKKDRPVRHRHEEPATAAVPSPAKHAPEIATPTGAPVAQGSAASAASSGGPSDPGAALRRARFNREADGDRHYQKALEFERAGETGRAIQEFQFARLLTPGNADVPLQLARLCLAQGLTEQAKHYFSHPLLRRNDEATSQIARIDSDRAEREERDWHWKVGATAGCFAWLPFVVALRLLRRRRKSVRSQTTISADELRPEQWLPEAAREMASPVPVASAAPQFEVIEPAPAPLEEAAPVEEAPRAPEPPKTFPGLPEFLKNLTSPKPVPPPAVPEEPAQVPPPIPVNEPAPFAAPEPVMEEPAVEIPAPPEPAAEPVAAARTPEPVAPMPPPDPNEILSVARTMEASLVRGNQHAAEGRLEEARRAYRTALVFNSSCASAHLGLGYLAFCEEKWETSLLHYRKALEIDPMSADAHYGVARVLLEINRVEDALPELRATLQIDPTYDDARDTLTALSKPA